MKFELALIQYDENGETKSVDKITGDTLVDLLVQLPTVIANVQKTFNKNDEEFPCH